jgi:hypothetical protein
MSCWIRASRPATAPTKHLMELMRINDARAAGAVNVW